MDDISAAQERLGKALSRARAGEDRALAGRVRDEGERLVKLLYGALGMAKMHALNNRAFDQPIADITRALVVLLDLLGAVHLLAVEDQVYMNDVRIRLDGGDIGQDFGAKLREHGVGGLSFYNPLSEAQFRSLVALMAREPGASARADLQAAFSAEGLDSVELSGIHHFRLAGEEGGEQAAADPARLAARGAALLDEVFDNLAANRQPNPLPMRRLVTGMLDAGAATEWIVVEPEGASPYAVHNLRICNLCLLLGNAVGLSPGVMQDLGVSVMFHDVGYALCAGSPEQRIVGKQGLELHPLLGVRILLRQRGFHEAKIRRVMVALDHHRRYDDSRGAPTLFGRISAIAEDYDTLTQPRAGGLSARRALSHMASAAGSVYDPVLLALFVNVMGAYPPRTRVRLSDGRVGCVVSLARGKQTFARPALRIERLASGRAVEGEMLVDLASEPGLAISGVVEEAADDDATPDAATLALVSEARRAAARVGASRPPSAPLSPAPAVKAAPVSRTTPATRRPLGEGTLPEMLRDLLLGEKTGTLHLHRQQRHLTLLIWKGTAIHASSDSAADHLESVAAREVILKAFTWADGYYNFDEHELTPQLIANPTLQLSTPDLILEAVGRIDDPDVVRYHLGDVGRRVRLSARPRVTVTAVGLTTLHGYVLSRVDGRMSMRELIDTVPGPRIEVLRSLFGLLCVGLIEYPPDAPPGR